MQSDELLQAQNDFDSNRLDSCIQRCKKYLSRNRNSSDAYLLLGKALFHSSTDYLTAEKSFRQSIILSPTSKDALYFIIRIYSIEHSRFYLPLASCFLFTLFFFRLRESVSFTTI